jgi:type II secretory pathway pseudopilin PulG
MAIYAGPGVTRPNNRFLTVGAQMSDQSRARKQAEPSNPVKKQNNRSLTVGAQLGGFTMMEIAISLAVIGIALVAIIGVLPIGMGVQQTNRQETIIGQDATVFMDAVRNGALGYDDLTNYVYAITNYWVEYKPHSAGGATNQLGVNGYTFSSATVDKNYLSEYCANYNVSPTSIARPLTNAAIILGLMSTPEYLFAPDETIAAGVIYTNNDFVYSNHIVVYCHSISGPAIEKPPQDNPILQQDSFSYRIFCVNAPDAPNVYDYTNGITTPYDDQMLGALHDLRLTFEWPQLPNGNLGPGRETFRTLVAGQLQRQPPLNPFTFPSSTVWYDSNLWTYVSGSFTNTP